MHLFELFDKPVDSSRHTTPPVKTATGHRSNTTKYDFTINGIKYFTVIKIKDVELFADQFTIPAPVLNAGGLSMSLDFAIEDMDGGYEWKAYERIGKGTHFKAFATVIQQGMTELKIRPSIRSIHIGALQEDVARKELYLRMAKRYFPNAQIIEVSNQPAEGTDYLQTRIFIIL